MGTLWFRRDCAFKHRLSHRNLACDSGDWAGMITALNDYPNAFLALKISGAAYVLWLAWKLIRAGRYDGQERQSQQPSGMGLFCYTES